jgi:hypothetical protein
VTGRSHELDAERRGEARRPFAPVRSPVFIFQTEPRVSVSSTGWSGPCVRARSPARAAAVPTRGPQGRHSCSNATPPLIQPHPQRGGMARVTPPPRGHAEVSYDRCRPYGAWGSVWVDRARYREVAPTGLPRAPPVDHNVTPTCRRSDVPTFQPSTQAPQGRHSCSNATSPLIQPQPRRGGMARTSPHHRVAMRRCRMTDAAPTGLGDPCGWTARASRPPTPGCSAWDRLCLVRCEGFGHIETEP